VFLVVGRARLGRAVRQRERLIVRTQIFFNLVEFESHKRFVELRSGTGTLKKHD